MSYINGPQIATNGLVLYLDAANNKSHPRSGTTWNDLSRNDNSASLSGAAFNSDGGGNISFDGTDDMGTVSNFYTSKYYSDNQAWTIFTFIRITQDKSIEGGVFNNQRFQTETDNSGPGGFGLSLYNGYCINMTYDNKNGTYTSYQRHTQMPILVNTWDCVCYTWNPTINTVTAYRAGNVYTQNTNATYKWSPRAAGLATRIARDTQGGWDAYYPMNIGLLSVYNRTLSDSEVLQNYNANKSRFL